MTVPASIARPVAEVRRAGDVPLWVHPEWEARFPWLAQGTTGAGDPDQPFDLGLSGRQEVGAVLERWRRLLAATAMRTAVHSRQIHAAEVWTHDHAPPPGILVMDGLDGHVTAQPDLLLSVSVADCVPVAVVAPESRAVALVHAGWRGTAANIVERGVALLAERHGAAPAQLWLHCGPSICGACYEVGPEVHAGVNPGHPVPSGPAPIDLRAAIAGRAAALGIPAGQITVSAHCTRCGEPDFFSHRCGSSARQMGVLGIRAQGPDA